MDVSTYKNAPTNTETFLAGRKTGLSGYNAALPDAGTNHTNQTKIARFAVA
jgi:hypothetical protein